MEGDSNIGRRRAAARAEGRAGYAQRRDEIKRAGAEVFKQRGFRGATLTHVAEALDTDRASLYYYYASKEELFEDIVSEAMRVNVRNADAIRNEGGPAPEILRRIVTTLMNSYEEFYPTLYVVIQENLNHASPERAAWAEAMRVINREYEQIVIDVVQQGQREGSLRDDAPAWLVAYGIIGMVGWSNRWFNPNRASLTADDIGTTFAELLLNGLVASTYRGADGAAPVGRAATPD